MTNFEQFQILSNIFVYLFLFVSTFPCLITFFFQLFDHEGEAEVTLRNTGKVGFEFSIIDPQREDEADEEGGRQRKAQEKAEQQPDALQQKYNKQTEKGQEVRPGRPMVIPTMVSSSWSYFTFGSVLYYFTSFVCVCFGVYVRVTLKLVRSVVCVCSTSRVSLRCSRSRFS